MNNLINNLLSTPYARIFPLKVLQADSDFEAFCIDYFFGTKSLFSDSMNKLQKMNLLLSVHHPQEILKNLRHYASTRALLGDHRGTSAICDVIELIAHDLQAEPSNIASALEPISSRSTAIPQSEIDDTAFSRPLPPIELVAESLQEAQDGEHCSLRVCIKNNSSGSIILHGIIAHAIRPASARCSPVVETGEIVRIETSICLPTRPSIVNYMFSHCFKILPMDALDLKFLLYSDWDMIDNQYCKIRGIIPQTQNVSKITEEKFLMIPTEQPKGCSALDYSFELLINNTELRMFTKVRRTDLLLRVRNRESL